MCTEIVESLLEKENIDVNKKTDNLGTALIEASRAGKKRVVKQLLNDKRVMLNTHHAKYGSALVGACYEAGRDDSLSCI